MTAIQPSPLKDRLTILRNIMLRTDLSAAEIRLCWFLLHERTNATTGECYTSDQNLARDLKLNLRTVERAKTRLHQKGILSWAPGQTTGTSSSYRFSLRLDRSTDREVYAEQTGTSPVYRPGPPPGQTTGTLHNKIYLKFSSPELEAWNAYERKIGKTTPRDYAGGWWFPTPWPPGHINAEAKQ